MRCRPPTLQGLLLRGTGRRRQEIGVALVAGTVPYTYGRTPALADIVAGPVIGPRLGRLRQETPYFTRWYKFCRRRGRPFSFFGDRPSSKGYVWMYRLCRQNSFSSGGKDKRSCWGRGTRPYRRNPPSAVRYIWYSCLRLSLFGQFFSDRGGSPCSPILIHDMVHSFLV